jgi:hypothetical protein
MWTRLLVVVWGLLVASACSQPQEREPIAPNAGALASAPSVSASAAPSASLALAPQPDSHLLMWRVNDTAEAATPRLTRGFLLGSIHVASKDLYPLDKRIETAFTKSDHLVLETDVLDPRAADMMADFVKQALLPRGQSIYDTLDKDLAARLKRRFTDLGSDPERFSGFKLWFVSMMLSMLDLEHAGYTGDNGIDAYFQRRADKRGIQLLTLEPLESQMQLLVSMGADATTQDLSLALDTDTIAEMQRMTGDWQRGDAEALSHEFDEMREKAPQAFDALFTQRNRKMAEGLNTFMQGPGTFFVVVGAGHLVGAGSVVDELQKRGYQVTQF